MHEFSIATALVDLVGKHVPPGTHLKSVVMEAGALQGIDPDAMEWAWRSATAGGPWEGSQLKVELLPWRLHCPACGQEHTSREVSADCPCGGHDCYPVGGDELRLLSLVVEDEEESQEKNDAGSGHRERTEAE